MFPKVIDSLQNERKPSSLYNLAIELNWHHSKITSYGEITFRIKEKLQREIIAQLELTSSSVQHSSDFFENAKFEKNNTKFSKISIFSFFLSFDRNFFLSFFVSQK